MAARRWYTYDSRERYLETGGINEAWWVKHRSLGRENSEESPYLLANEWICSSIGRFLRLPIPPFALMRRGGKGMFLSGRYGAVDSTPDDVKPDICFRAMPKLCTGILLFDILIANPDRHSGNLKVDDPLNPKEVEVFDHDRALFGSSPGRGIERFGRLLDRLGTSGGSVTGQNDNCLLGVASTSRHFHEWLQRIESIPDWFICETCEETRSIPTTAEELEVVTSFLKERKRKLPDIIRNNKDKFPNIKEWELTL